MRGPNASAASCHRGYRLYYRMRVQGLILGRDQINDRLEVLGFDAVSERTYRNYGRNFDREIGPDNYSPINRIDYNVPKGPSDVPGEFVDGGRD